MFPVRKDLVLHEVSQEARESPRGEAPYFDKARLGLVYLGLIIKNLQFPGINYAHLKLNSN